MPFELRISTCEHYMQYLLSGSAHRHSPTPALGPSAPTAAHRGFHSLSVRAELLLLMLLTRLLILP